MGITARISIALMMIAVIALIASGMAIFFLKEFDRNYQEVSRQKVPAVIAAAQMIRLTQRLIADAPAIVMAENQIIRNDVMRDVEQDEKQKDDILNNLRSFGSEVGAKNLSPLQLSLSLKSPIPGSVFRVKIWKRYSIRFSRRAIRNAGQKEQGWDCQSAGIW